MIVSGRLCIGFAVLKNAVIGKAISEFALPGRSASKRVFYQGKLE